MQIYAKFSINLHVNSHTGTLKLKKVLLVLIQYIR